MCTSTTVASQQAGRGFDYQAWGLSLRSLHVLAVSVSIFSMFRVATLRVCQWLNWFVYFQRGPAITGDLHSLNSAFALWQLKYTPAKPCEKDSIKQKHFQVLEALCLSFTHLSSSRTYLTLNTSS